MADTSTNQRISTGVRMTADFVCLSCGWTGSHRRCIWVYRTGPGNSSFSCPECYTQAWRAELEAQWPSLPDLEGIDRFLEQYGPPTGAEDA